MTRLRFSGGIALAASATIAFAQAEVIHLPIGVTAEGSPIHATVQEAALDPTAEKPSVLLVAGLDGQDDSVDLAAALMRSAATDAYTLSAVLNVFPDRDPVPEFPPKGPFYGPPSAESQYLWRFLGMLAPDIVIDLRADDRPSPLAEALSRGLQPADVGRIAATTMRFEPADKSLDQLGREISGRLAEVADGLGVSGARRELRQRLERSPLEVALQLEKEYGHALENAMYIPALALIGRLRLGDLDGASRLADVERLAAPYLEGKPSLGTRSTGSHVSGHLVFAELYKRTEKSDYLDLVRAAADLGFESDRSLKESMPFHNEMSDSVFMGCAILARAGRLTAEGRYFRMALKHLQFMQALDRRPDELYRHSPLDDAAWGRGNGFPALGLALALTDWPEDEHGYAEVRDSHVRHLRALARHQDPTGTWHQVVDRPESYREFSSTAMIGFAVTRGLREGWLDRDEFEPVSDRAWRAVSLRVKSDATLVDVCRSTGRQDSLRAYYAREAILGRDDRGGAMALLFATERAFWARAR